MLNFGVEKKFERVKQAKWGKYFSMKKFNAYILTFSLI